MRQNTHQYLVGSNDHPARGRACSLCTSERSSYDKPPPRLPSNHQLGCYREWLSTTIDDSTSCGPFCPQSVGCLLRSLACADSQKLKCIWQSGTTSHTSQTRRRKQRCLHWSLTECKLVEIVVLFPPRPCITINPRKGRVARAACQLLQLQSELMQRPAVRLQCALRLQGRCRMGCYPASRQCVCLYLYE